MAYTHGNNGGQVDIQNFTKLNPIIYLHFFDVNCFQFLHYKVFIVLFVCMLAIYIVAALSGKSMFLCICIGR